MCPVVYIAIAKVKVRTLQISKWGTQTQYSVLGPDQRLAGHSRLMYVVHIMCMHNGTCNFTGMHIYTATHKHKHGFSVEAIFSDPQIHYYLKEYSAL